MGTSARRLRVPVAGCLEDQIMIHSTDIHGNLVKMISRFNSETQ